MKLRSLSALNALLLALAVSGEAAAQSYRVGPDAGYRSAPDMDDDDDYPGASPNTYGRPVPRAPVGGRVYEEERPVYAPRRDQGYTGSLPSQGNAHREQLPPPGEAGPGYATRPAAPSAPQAYENQRPEYGRPADRQQGYEPAPQGRPDGRPPVDLNAARQAPPPAGAREARDPREPQGPRDRAPTQAEVEAVQQGKIEDMDPRFRRQVVDYRTKEAPGTLIVDTTNTYLYLVMEGGKAMRYGIGVGREGFTWAGRQKISRMKEWPDWYPPAEMIERQPYLPRWMAGGPSNPMGARALYLGNTLYRIHGTNDPTTIGKFVSSGCIRLFNADVEDLYSRVQTGTNVVVLPKQGGAPTQLSPERLPGMPEPGQASTGQAPAQPAANAVPRPRGGVQAAR